MLEHVCEVCGKRNRKKLKANGLVVCSKHYSQFKHYGYFRDNSPRTQKDRKRIKNLAVRVFFYTFGGRIATKLLFKILFGIT